MAFIEALFATSLLRDAVPLHQRVRIEVRATGKSTGGGQHLILFPGKGGNPFNVEFNEDYDCEDENRTGVMLALLNEAVPHLLTNVLYVPDPKAYLDRLCLEEDAVTRAMMAAQSFMFVNDVEPHDRATAMSTWLDETESFPLLREIPLSARGDGHSKKGPRPFKPGKGEPPEMFTRSEAITHRQRKIISVINTKLWTDARWRGAALAAEGNRPFVGLIFEDEQSAEEVFRDWRSEFGHSDDHDTIRISLITGVSRKAPFRYRMHITGGASSRPEHIGSGQIVMMVSKKMTMEATSPKNLDVFIAKYRVGAEYALVPVFLERGGPRVRFDLAMMKRHLVIRPAWEIGEHDPDSIAIEPDDDPIIPAGVTDAPVEKVLARNRARANRSPRK